MSGLEQVSGVKWNIVERGCAPLAQIVLVYGLYLWGMLHVLARNDRQQLINVEVVQNQLPVFIGVIGGALLLLLAGVVLRKRRPDSLLFQHIGAQYYSMTLIWVGYLSGTQSFATGAVLISAALAGYITLERKVIQLGSAVAFALVLGLNIAANADWIPYAPALVPPHDPHSFLFWAKSSLFIAAPHVIMGIVLVAIVIRLWLITEAKVLQQSLTDTLTGLHNRRSILKLVKTEVAHTQQHGPPLAIAILDLDYFKKINDRWGHPTGDQILRATAQCLQDNLRNGDAVGRLGGEEFLLLMPDTTSHDAKILIEHCRKALEQIEIYSDSGEPVRVSGSFGIVCNEKNMTLDAEILISTADQALYRAKKAGRNRTTVAATPTAPLANNSPFTHLRKRHVTISTVRHMINQLTKGAPSWTPVMKTALMAGLGTSQFLFYASWSFFLLLLPHPNERINIDLVVAIAPIVILVIAGMALLTYIGIKLNRTHPQSSLYQHITHQYYGATLVLAGYFIGTLSLPVGILIIGSPLIGFIFFRQVYVIAGTITSMTLLVTLTYASALEYIPYAPLMAQPKYTFYVADPLWLAGLYILIIPNIIIIIYLADQTLGHWRKRSLKTRAISLTDALTGTHSRRSILNLLELELARTFHRGPPLALILLDMDHFKHINDTWGHPTGDKVLQTAAAQLQEVIRSCDAIGRLGGEEFVIILPDTTLEGARALAERCRQQLEQYTMLSDDGKPLKMRASFGLTGNEHCLTLSSADLIKAADEALYNAKKAGKNRVEVMHASQNGLPIT